VYIATAAGRRREKLFNDFRPNTTRRVLIIQRLDNSLSPVEDLLINERDNNGGKITISQGKTSFNGKSKSCRTDISNKKI